MPPIGVSASGATHGSAHPNRFAPSPSLQQRSAILGPWREVIPSLCQADTAPPYDCGMLDAARRRLRAILAAFREPIDARRRGTPHAELAAKRLSRECRHPADRQPCRRRGATSRLVARYVQRPLSSRDTAGLYEAHPLRRTVECAHESVDAVLTWDLGAREDAYRKSCNVGSGAPVGYRPEAR